MTDPQVIEAIKKVLDQDPRNGVLWVHYAELLEGAEREADALAALRTALEVGVEERGLGARFIRLLRRNGNTAEALIRAEKRLEQGDDPGVRLELARILLDRGMTEEARAQYDRVVASEAELRDPALEQALHGNDAGGGANHEPHGEGAGDGARIGLHGEGAVDSGQETTGDVREEDPLPFPDTHGEAASDVSSHLEDPLWSDEGDPAMAEVAPEAMTDEEWAAQFDWTGLRVTFEDVAGLEEVKKQIHLRIIAPFKNPEIYQAFKRQGGGGLLLYGPPGCGKTYIARATAGELGARFVTVSFHEVIDKMWGESEKMIHSLFVHARRQTPTVLFFDEFDALGSSRGKSESQFFRTLVNQLLQEMDGMEGRNEDILVFAATNMPWNVDSAFRRPGRFDRVLFVPPPDREARIQIMRSNLEKVPGGASVDPKKVVKETRLMTGADLKALCDQAVEYALERSLESGKVNAVSMADFKRAMKNVKSTAMEWLATARNYATYANEGGQYDDLAEFLRKVKKY